MSNRQYQDYVSIPDSPSERNYRDVVKHQAGLNDLITDHSKRNGGENRKKETEKKAKQRLERLKSRVHETLVDILPPAVLRGEEDQEANQIEVRNRIGDLLVELSSKDKISLSQKELERVKDELMNEVYGLGPLEPLIRRDDLNEIMVNGPDHVYVEKKGRLVETDTTFYDSNHLMNVIHRIVAPLGRHVDVSTPFVDARLSDGSRVNIIIPPLVMQGPMVTIRNSRRIHDNDPRE